MGKNIREQTEGDIVHRRQEWKIGDGGNIFI
jgi:hypothetical protein